jgi:hypothetical protein
MPANSAQSTRADPEVRDNFIRVPVLGHHIKITTLGPEIWCFACTIMQALCVNYARFYAINIVKTMILLYVMERLRYNIII